VFLVMWVFVLTNDRFRETVGVWFNEREGAVLRMLSDARTEWLTPVIEGINAAGSRWAVPVIGWVTIILLLAAKRLRHLFVYFGVLVGVTLLVSYVALAIERPRPWGIEIIAPWEGYGQPSLPMAQLTVVLVGAGYCLIPLVRGRRMFIAVTALVLVTFGSARAYLGVEYLTDTLVGALVGASAAAVAFLLICPEKVFPVGFRRGRTAHLDLGGARGEAIRAALSEQLGIGVTTVEPVGLADSAGSTPMRLTRIEGDPPVLFAKLYASSHLRSDRWYKLGRTLAYGRLEDEGRFTNVRRLVEREDYLMRVMRDAEIRVPQPLGIATITPEREYLIVTEFLDGAVEATDAEIDDTVIDDALLQVRRMWDHGLAHRDIKPSNVMVRDRTVYLIDVAFGQMRPSPWREAVDLANMMLTLALRSSADQVYARALQFFTPDEIAEAFAASRGITLPSQLRHEVKADSRDLVAEFRRLAPARPLLPIQRWSVRRVGLAIAVLVLVGLGLMFGVLNLEGIGLL